MLETLIVVLVVLWLLGLVSSYTMGDSSTFSSSLPSSCCCSASFEAGESPSPPRGAVPIRRPGPLIQEETT